MRYLSILSQCGSCPQMGAVSLVAWLYQDGSIYFSPRLVRLLISYKNLILIKIVSFEIATHLHLLEVMASCLEACIGVKE